MSGAFWPSGSADVPRITRVFGYRSSIYSGGIHKGVDTVGHTYNHSPEDGRVIYAGYNGQYGNEVRVRGNSGKIHRIGHHSRFLVSVGQNVSKGQAVGVLGATGMVTGPHCHWEVRTGSESGSYEDPGAWVVRMNTSVASVSSGQRTVGDGGAKRRAQPTTKSESKDPALAAGEVGNFNGWIHGENVSGNDVWYRGTSGDWFWSGGFREGANGTGLEDLNPAKITPTQRKAGPEGVKRRAEPTTASASMDNPLAAGDIGNFDGWINGEVVSGNGVWFRGSSGNYFWSGGFEDKGTHDLADLNPKAPTLSSSQRKVLEGKTATRRSEPTSKSAEAGAYLDSGVVGNFNGWTHGEAVNGNDIWFRGTSGDWFWSGGFEGGSNTAGLPEITIPKPTTAERTVLADKAVNLRSGPATTFGIVGSLPAGVTSTFNGWAKGEAVSDNDTWFVNSTNQWAWSGAFTSTATTGLTQTLPPTPPVKLDTAYKTFKSDTKLAKWIGSPNYNYRDPRPAGSAPKHITLHWFGTANPKLSDTDSYFQNPGDIQSTGRGNGTASNYGVGSGEVHQYVREQDYQQADGNRESNTWGISIEHEAGPSVPPRESTIELSAQLCADIAKRYGWTGLVWMVNVFPHKHWAATECPGTLPTQRIIDRANEILSGESEIPVEPEIPEVPEVPEDGELAALRASWAAFKAKMDAYLT